jgi:hypothetical protein
MLFCMLDILSSSIPWSCHNAALSGIKDLAAESSARMRMHFFYFESRLSSLDMAYIIWPSFMVIYI